VDVDLIGVEDRFAGACFGLKRSNLREPSETRVARPRTKDDRLRRTKTGTDCGQRTTHRANGYLRPPLLLHLEAKQLTRPRRAAPAEILRSTGEYLCDPLPETLVGLPGAVVPSLIVQAFDAQLREPIRSAHDRRSSQVQVVGHPDAAVAPSQTSDSLKPQRSRWIATLAALADEPSSLCATHVR